MARFSVVVVALLSVGVALAQDSRGGRSSRGRNRGDRSMSADDSSQRGSRLQSFVQRMDTNNNGMIDAEEVAGPQRAFVERIFSRSGIEAKYPIPISQIVQAMTNASGGGRSGGRSSSAVGSSSGNATGTPSGTKPGETKPTPPAISGFGASNGGGIMSVTVAGPSNLPAPSKPANTDAAAPDHAAEPKTHAPDSGSAASTAEAAKPSPRKSGRFLTPKERLAKGLPDWFLQKDADGDGQVMMAEFAKDWTPEMAAEFNRFDLNHDGIVTAAECLKAAKAKATSRP